MRATTCLLAVTLVACAAGDATLDPIELQEPTGAVTLVREATTSEAGGYDLFVPTRPTPLNGGVWLLESSNDQIVRYDSTLSQARTFARSGQGPGELEYAQDLLHRGDELIVAETGNGRLSIFDTTGAFRRIVTTAESPIFVGATSERLLTATGNRSAYVFAVEQDGGLREHAAVPEAIQLLGASDPDTYLAAGPYMTTSDTGELFVLDQSVLAITEYDATGTVVTSRSLPDPMRAELLDRRLKQIAGFGRNASAFVDTPATKRIRLGADGRLLVLFSLPSAWGMLIDTSSWTARPLAYPENTRARDILWAASDATLDGDRLYVVSGHQLYQFAVEGW